MTPRQIRGVRVAFRFLPGLWGFGYPSEERGLRSLRLLALVVWCYAFKLRVRFLGV